MRPPFTPIQACVREPATQCPSCLDVNAKSFKRLRSNYSDFISIVGASRSGREPSHGLEAVVEQYAHCAGHVIVTSPRKHEATWSICHELLARAAGEHAQSFERTGLLGSCKILETLSPLNKQLTRVTCLEPIQMCARG